MRVLCLHGYLQDGQTIRKKIQRWKLDRRLAPGEKLELICPDGPFEVTENATGKKGRGWWPVDVHAKLAEAPSRENLSRGVEVGTKALAGNPHVDLVVGFSQGCACTTWWLQQKVVIPRGVVLMGGFLPRDFFTSLTLEQMPLFSVPLLWMRGQRDDLLDQVESLLVGELKFMDLFAFSGTKVHLHRWGHVIPSDKGSIDLVMEFMREISTPNEGSISQ